MLIKKLALSIKTLLFVVYRILGAADDRIECIVSSTPQYSAVLHNMVGTVFMDLERNLESVEKFNHSGMYIIIIASITR